MSPTPSPSPVRRPRCSRGERRRTPARTLLRGAVAGGFLVLAASSPAAFADEPVGWESSPSVSGLHYFLILLLIPLGLALVISLLVAIPSWVRGSSYQAGQPWAAGDEWFGGPKEGVETASTPQQIEAAGDQGGAGARY